MRTRALTLAVAAALILLAGWAFLRTRGGVSSLLIYQQEPVGIMGTTTKLVLVLDRDQADRAERTLSAAVAELRRLEALLSTWIDSSPVSRFNAAPPLEPVAVPSELHDILTLGRELYAATNGAFDITARPLIELWREAAVRGIRPNAASLHAARQRSSWDQIQLADRVATKALPSTRVDIDGIAKGYAIDRALEALQRAAVAGGMVEVGGDLRVFGSGPDDRMWTVAIRSPFADRTWAEIELAEGAVCSSGDYARPIEIEGRRYSHIIDPRNGRPVELVRAVTVVGPDAATADAWATALSVLGVDGMSLLSDELHALVVTGQADDYRVHVSPGFRELLVRAAFELEE